VSPRERVDRQAESTTLPSRATTERADTGTHEVIELHVGLYGSRATDALAARVGALRALGCGTLELAWVAAGRLHGWIQADVAPWDWHPGALLVREAGGVARVAGRWHAAAASESLTAELLERLP